MLSDISIKRPVLATVAALILIIVGALSFLRLPLREYPDIDPPVVTVETNYPGASSSVVESRITKLIEDRIAGVEGIRFIDSQSKDGESVVTIEFDTNRDIDAAANDIRDRISGIIDDLPEEADPPEIQKVDSSDDVIIWLNFVGEGMTVPELTDYADRYLVDRFSVLDGVARVRIGGGQRYAMRVWLDRGEMSARGITVSDIENALRAENVELPAGSIESQDRQFSVRVERMFNNSRDFEDLVITRGSDGYLVRLRDIGNVEVSTVESRISFKGNEIPMVGLGIIKQSTANTIDVAEAAKQERIRVNKTLPEGMEIKLSYDTSVFIKESIQEVYNTLLIAIGLVVCVIYLFLGNFRAMIVPAVTVPISVVGTFIFLNIFGFSINLLTLLSLVLAIGLVVDDAIVVLENISRRIEEHGEHPIIAAFLGTRQVFFAVLSTTIVLVSVFLPIAFMGGDIGRLFSEFALTMAAAVSISSFVALSLSSMLASKFLKKKENKSTISIKLDALFTRVSNLYSKTLAYTMKLRWLTLLVLALIGYATYWIYQKLPQEYAPKEDRGAFFVLVNGPEGASYSYMEEYMNEIEKRMIKYVHSEEMTRLLVRAPRSFGALENFNSGIVICVLNDWANRRSAWVMMDEIRKDLSDLSGVRAFPLMRQGIGARIAKPVQFVIGGGTYEQLANWRDILNEKISQNNPGLIGVDWDYKETKPQILVDIDYNQAADLGVTLSDIGRTLETMLGSRRVTTYKNEGEEYDLILEGIRNLQNTPSDIGNLYVRSQRTGELIPLSSLTNLHEVSTSNELNRYNRVRALTLEANLTDGYPLGDALTYLENLVREELPPEAIIDYKGQSRDFRTSSESILFIFFIGIIVVYLVLAGQFESFIHPLAIMISVPLAVFGGLLGLYISGGSLNIYSQVGLIMLVGLSAKNGILIVEFANQLRDQGMNLKDALQEATRTRFRPILMTGITTLAGSLPLIFSSGAGSEVRNVIGIVIFCGVLSSIIFTLYIIPLFYSILAPFTKTTGHIEKFIDEELKKNRINK
jgi:multidrug efflux pump